MSVLNVNMPERDLDPEELDLEQEEEDAFGTCSSSYLHIRVQSMNDPTGK